MLRRKRLQQPPERNKLFSAVLLFRKYMPLLITILDEFFPWSIAKKLKIFPALGNRLTGSCVCLVWPLHARPTKQVQI